MGSQFIMMKLAILFACLALSQCAPVSLSPEEMQTVTTDVQNAKENLEQMVQMEDQEINQMNGVKQTIEGLNNGRLTEAAVAKAAEQVRGDEQQAADDEQKQQNNALQALKQVENVKPIMQKFKMASGPLQKAAVKIDQVADTLTRGTKTMNNQHLINSMADESTKLLNKIDGRGNKELGETGVLSNLNEQPKAQPQGGVLSMLKQAPQKDPLAAAQDDLKQLQKESPEENSVVEAERRAETEIKGLIGDLA